MSISTKMIAAGALSSVMALLPAAAFAQTTPPGGSGNDCRTSNGVTMLGTATLPQIIAVGDCEIHFRDVYLQAAETRVNQLQKVSSSTQQSLQATLVSTIGTLGTIKTTLDADTATSTALTDYRSIYNTVRVFALVLPRTWIYATSDREMTISGDLQSVNGELTTKNGMASSTVQTENAPFFADVTTQLSALNSDSTNADSTVQPLVPDQGSTTTQASNAAALQSARGMLQSGQTAITAIVKDFQQIRANLGV